MNSSAFTGEYIRNVCVFIFSGLEMTPVQICRTSSIKAHAGFEGNESQICEPGDWKSQHVQRDINCFCVLFMFYTEYLKKKCLKIV